MRSSHMNNFNDVDYKLLQNKNESWNCIPYIEELNNFTDELKDYDENLTNCKYRDLGYFQNVSEKVESKWAFN